MPELRLSRTRRRISDEDEDLVNIKRLWTYPWEITDTDFVCQACWDLANHASDQVVPPERQLGHQNVCVGCGRSILRSRSRVVLRPDWTDEERLLAEIISQWIHPRQLIPTNEACGPCWLRAQRILRLNIGTQTAQPQPIDASEDTSITENSSPQHEEIEDSCINCEIQLASEENRYCLLSESEQLIRVIKLWTYPKNILDTDYICHACWELANHQVMSELEDRKYKAASGEPGSTPATVYYK